MHNVKSNQEVKIIQLEIAVPINSEYEDEISTLLSLLGTYNNDSAILDWRYTGNEWASQASEDPEEGEIFFQPRSTIQTFKRGGVDYVRNQIQIRSYR